MQPCSRIYYSSVS